jgi:vesicular inhibitory amino acid transporter
MIEMDDSGLQPQSGMTGGRISSASQSSLPTHHKVTGHGISVVTACLFLIGEIAGAGVLAMPEALKSCGWYLGIFLMMIACAGSAVCGVLLSECWNQMERDDPSLAKTKTRNPYSVIGFKAYGKWGANVTVVSLVLTLFGGSIVQLLLSAEFIHTLLKPVISADISFGEWVIIVGLILLPLTFLGSPVDFSPIAFFAMSSTSVAAVLVMISCLIYDAPTNESLPTYRISFMGVLVGTGSMCFAFSGASCMPTIQNDMKNKKSFTKSVLIAFGILILIYMPVSIISLHKFGDGIKSNIIRNLPQTGLTTAIKVLMAGHVLCAYLILMNPVNLNIENFIGVDHSFNFFRCFSRVLMTLLAIFIGLSTPKFGKLLSLVGASAVVIQTYILPILFYYKLRKDEGAGITTRMKVMLLVILIASVLTAVGATYSAIYDLLDPNAFTKPCYVARCDLDD